MTAQTTVHDDMRASAGSRPTTWLITGGPGPERHGSLISGRDVAAAFAEMGIEHRTIDLVSIADADLQPGDVAFLTTHGQWGEDGKLQGFLETLRVSYTGPGVLGAAMSMHKAVTNRVAESVGVSVPVWLRVTAATPSVQIGSFVDRHGPRVVLRPATGGGSRGVVVGESAEMILAALADTTWEHPDFVLSPFVVGKEISAACIATSDGVQHLPVLQTEFDGQLYDYTIKHDATLRRHLCPAPLAEHTVRSLRRSCERLYERLGLSGFARFDFLVPGDGVPRFLEVNALPGMARSGNLATMAAAGGVAYPELVRRQLASAVSTDRYRS